MNKIKYALGDEERFRQLIKNSFDMIVLLYSNGIQQYVSESCEKILGYKPEELMGISVIETMIHPEDQESTKRDFIEMVENKTNGGAQYRHRHKNGGWVYLEAFGTNQLDNPIIHPSYFMFVTSRNGKTLKKSLKTMKPFLILIILVFGIILSAQSALAQTEAANPDFVSLFRTSEETEVACYRIPALVTAPNGDLIAAIDERVPSCGDLKWNNDINIVIRRSSDNGQTWTAIERVIDYPIGMSASDPSMIVDQVTSEIILFYNFMDLENEKDVYYLKMVKSKDNGQTWSDGIVIYSGSAAYYSMTLLSDGNIGLFFEKDGYQDNVFVSIDLS